MKMEKFTYAFSSVAHCASPSDCNSGQKSPKASLGTHATIHTPTTPNQLSEISLSNIAQLTSAQ